MYCRYCGREIESNVSCCPYCGKSTIGINEPTKSTKERAIKEKKRKGPRIFLTVLALLLLVILIKENYHVIVHANRQNNDTCNEIYILRVKENFADSITYNSRITTENDVAEEKENSTNIRRVSRINYYNFDGVLIYYESYAYYDNGLLCSTTLHSVNYSASDDTSYIWDQYTILYLYDDEGNLTQTVLDAFTTGKWYDKDNGKITLGYVYDSNGNSNKITICPERESIEQEKYGVDPNKTEKIYGSVPIISTDSSNGWASAYLGDIFDGDEPTDMTTYRFIYVDNNTQPELWIDYGYTDVEIYTASNGTTDNIFMSHGGAYWIEGCNILLATGGHMDAHYDTIYQIQNGKFITTAEGNYGAEDNSNIQCDEDDNPVYNYYWNNTKVTQSEYEQCLSDAFEMKSAMDIYQNIYTYNQCKLLLHVIVESST